VTNVIELTNDALKTLTQNPTPSTTLIESSLDQNQNLEMNLRFIKPSQ